MRINFKQWKQEAAKLLNRPPAPDLLDWYDEERKTYYRFDKKTHRLVAGDIRGTINTYFVLKKSKYKSYIPEKFLGKNFLLKSNRVLIMKTRKERSA